MNHNHYILKDKVPVAVDLLEWAKWFGEADRQVDRTVIDIGEEVSTVFLGLDHQWGDGPALLFETMVFGGSFDGKQWRYSTWEEAEAGHKRMVERVMKGRVGL